MSRDLSQSGKPIAYIQADSATSRSVSPNLARYCCWSYPGHGTEQLRQLFYITGIRPQKTEKVELKKRNVIQ